MITDSYVFGGCDGPWAGDRRTSPKPPISRKNRCADARLGHDWQSAGCVVSLVRLTNRSLTERLEYAPMSSNVDTTLLHSPIFEDIPADAVAELCSRGRSVSFDAGRLLFERGQDADELMILQEGGVELLFPVMILGVTREVTMETKQPGAVVAWSSLVGPYHFTLSARCACDCRLVSFMRDTLHSFFETDPDTGYRFMRNLAGVIGRRLQAMQTLWMHDLQASAAKRL